MAPPESPSEFLYPPDLFSSDPPPASPSNPTTQQLNTFPPWTCVRTRPRWEKKFALSNDPKDLKRLTTARQRLSKIEQAIAKEMNREAKAQGMVNKLQGSLTGTEGAMQERSESKEEVQRIIRELKRKQEQIR